MQRFPVVKFQHAYRELMPNLNMVARRRDESLSTSATGSLSSTSDLLLLNSWIRQVRDLERRILFCNRRNNVSRYR